MSGGGSGTAQTYNGSTYISVNNSTYTIGLGLSTLITDITGYSDSGNNKNYAVQSSNNKLYVNVPWENNRDYVFRKFSSGLQIADGYGASDDLYVPYADSNQIGVIRLAAGTSIDSISYNNGVATINAKAYSSKSASNGGTDVSLVTTGEKYTWNHKSDFTGYTTTNKLAANCISNDLN